MKSDETWMKEYQQGSEEAFAFLYEKYSPMVYGFIKKRIPESEVDDLYQKVWRKLHEFRGSFRDQPFAPWLFVIVRNAVIDEYRSLGRRNGQEFQEEYLRREVRGEEIDLDELLHSLSPENQTLVRKYYLEGVSYEELELETGLTQTNLRQRLSRALKGLRKKLYEE